MAGDERWRRLNEIWQSALQLEPGRRAGFVRDACAGDEELRAEIESLLACEDNAGSFLEPPAAPQPSGVLESALTGRTVAHYQILEKLGEGGMGVVYKARDTHLDRFVAIKVLPAERVADAERKRRFVQEAKAASALNHPNIITIHDISSEAGMDFIAMEYVPGSTLDQLIGSTGMRLSEALKCAIEIADALAAAHGVGIVHRDIKPSNVMVTGPASGRPGRVKVLDFGLAKLIETTAPGEDQAARTLKTATEEGAIVGTVAYMSPEQAQGKPVDARSDIFSFGSVLYEMTTGQRAFSGPTNASTLAAILRDDPAPVTQVALDTPPELERIISRCLRKDPQRRFQNMADVKVALEELIEETQSAELAVTARRRRTLAWAGGAFLLLAAAGVGAWFGLFRPAAGPAPTVTAFTALPGIQTGPALSPDGKQIAFVWNGEKQDNYDIHVQLVGDTTPRRLTSSSAFEYSPVWSPDALHIAFLRETPAGTEVIVIPAAGGVEKRLHVSKASCGVGVLSQQFCGLAWSPDGKFLTMVDKDSPQAAHSVFLLDIETREKRQLTAPPRGFDDGVSAFSPDGSMLAFARFGGLPLSDIYVLPLSRGGQPRAEPRRVTHDNVFIYGLDWASDGRSIVFASTRGGVYALWRVASSGGAPERLPVGSTDALWPSISRTGDRLAFAYGTLDPHLWRVAAPGGGHPSSAPAPVRVAHSPRLEQDPVFSPDARKIAWASTHSGSHQIWVSGTDGSLPVKLTNLAPPGAASPQWSPDGRQIAFQGFSLGPTHVYVIEADGGAPHRLTAGDYSEDRPSWSHDGKWVYFMSNRGEGRALWRAPAGGGSPALVTRGGGEILEHSHRGFLYYSRWWRSISEQGRPIESFDAKSVYYNGADGSIWKVPAGGGSSVLLADQGGWPFFESFDGKFVYCGGPEAGIWKVPAGGGKAVPVVKAGKRAIWTLSAADIYVLDPDAQGGPSIELFPFGNKPREVVRLPGDPDGYAYPLPLLAVSPDGRWIVYLLPDRGEGQIMLAENFR